MILIMMIGWVGAVGVVSSTNRDLEWGQGGAERERLSRAPLKSFTSSVKRAPFKAPEEFDTSPVLGRWRSRESLQQHDIRIWKSKNTAKG